MTTEQYFKNLQPPVRPVDVILDTDTYNEIDDQFAIAYLLRSEGLNVKGICAAPFSNSKAAGPEEGMEKSYDEIMKILSLMGKEEMKQKVYHGSKAYLPDEKTPVMSDAAMFMAEEAKKYTSENPLYIVAIGAITNVASAILLNPGMIETTVVVWLGGHAHHWPHNREFNLEQDVAGARVIFGCGVPVVQLPCGGVVDIFYTSRPELEYWLKGKNALCDYLAENTIQEAESYAAGKPWTRVIWDVTAVAWLLNKDNRFMRMELRHSPIPEYDDRWAFDHGRHLMAYAAQIYRDRLFEDLFRKLAGG